jgi:hypothetical protein
VVEEKREFLALARLHSYELLVVELKKDSHRSKFEGV